MSEQHPLTDKVCDHLTDELDKIERFFWFDAPWQLEQVIECIQATLMEGYLYTRPRSSVAYVNKEAFLEDLKAAMRPQQQENN